MFLRFQSAAFAAVLLLVAPPHADASEAIRLKIDFAHILKLDEAAATVIIGNIGIADATVRDETTLVLTGKAAGATNLIILDPAGEELLNTVLNVGYSSSAMTTVYYGRSRQTYACAPKCEAVIAVGDDPKHFGEANDQITGRKAFSGF